VNRRDHRVKVDHHVNRRSDLRDDDHRLPLDDRHRMGCLGVDDLKMDVNSDVSRGHHMNDLLGGHLMGASRVNRNYVRRDQKMVVMMDASRGLHMNDLLDDHSMDDGLMKDANHDHRMNDPLDDRNLDDDRRDALDGHHKNVMDDQNDLMTDVNLDVSLYLHMNDPLDDHSMDASRGLRMSDLLGDQNSDVMTDENRGNRNCVRRDQNLVVMTDVSRGLRMNGTDDRNDLKTDGKKDAMNRRVMCY
jgi:hypothetical protein